MKFNQIIRHFFFSKKSKPNFGKYSIVHPGKVSPKKQVPDNIPKPSYFRTGEPSENVMVSEIKQSGQIQSMRDSCRLAANILETVGHSIKVGQTTDDIDTLVHKLCIQYGAYPSPLNYKNFPKSVCTSVNNVTCHGIPDDRPLEDGDIVNVDITVFYKGYHGDCSKTFLVGNVDEEGKWLVEATEVCLEEGINVCRPGAYFRDIGYAIEQKASELSYTVVPAFLGHGIGSYFHGPPEIYHINMCF
ncbi:methionine aminopeptidase 1D, mitochondrial isoform X2 [Anthonomus grandis grandis]|uniref:methionine aminopeptidase 1D, mitochondrial isoform X2 n=1 Tax=Anthonomus grandis grandis TaxID=2921223 RepID=UPI002166B30C|nr:methionine aminopeptidase 1D, mitochondrial isoform X2 [Anthonomus grandis grandis]